jgi:iron complex transport system permease protein
MTRREGIALALSTLALAASLAVALGLALPGEGEEAARILTRVRLPEAAVALLVGGSLGLSGLLFQLVLRNPLADPYVLGVAGGATFATVLVLLMSGGAAALLGLSLQAGAAFVGGMATLVLLMRLAEGKAESLLLCGVVANTAFAAGARLVTVWLSPSEIATVTAYLVGFIPTPSWVAPALLAPPAAYAFVRFSRAGRGLDLLLLTDEEAASLGLAVGRVRREALILATLLASASVALCGMVGFVGLVVPHVARLLAGHRHRVLVPASFLLGAAFLLVAHAAGKALSGTWFLPVGVYTTLVGAPVFLTLLVRSSRRAWP